jgi:hypothetical protein
MPQPRSLVGLFGLVLLSGCPLLDLQADVQSACATYSGVQIAAMPSVTTTIEQSFTVDDISALQQLTDDGFQLTFERGDVLPDTGITSLGFVDSAEITVTTGSGSASGSGNAASATLPPLDFACANCGSAGSDLAFEPAGSAGSATDAAPYVAGGSLVVTVDLTGTPPAVAWSMNVDVCVTATASVQVDE